MAKQEDQYLCDTCKRTKGKDEVKGLKLDINNKTIDINDNIEDEITHICTKCIDYIWGYASNCMKPLTWIKGKE